MGNRKVKVYVLGRDWVGWSIDKDRNAIIQFLKKENFEITRNILASSLILCVWYDLLLSRRYVWVMFYRRILKRKVIAIITNDITLYPKKLETIHKHADVFLAPSRKICQCLKKKNLRAYRIPFFVDSEIFYPQYIFEKERCAKLGINHKLLENKIVIGSFQRDSLGKNLSTPKWEKNPDLLIEILRSLPERNFILLLAGPRRHYIINQCQEHKIPYYFYGDHSYIDEKKDDIFANNLSSEIINNLYDLLDIHIITSRSEGGPKSILESALTKTIIFSTEVGLAPDILHPYLLFKENNVEDLIEKISKYIANPLESQSYVEYNYKRAKKEVDRNLLEERYKKIIVETLQI